MNNVQDFDYNLNAVGSLLFTLAVVFVGILYCWYVAFKFINLKVLEPTADFVYLKVRTMQTKPENRHVD